MKLHLALALLAVGCAKQPTPYTFNLPASLPLPIVPSTNPMTVEKVTLGRYLFYEKNLSGNQSYACSNCHQQRNAFTDGRPTPIGSTGQQLPRNTMPLINAAYEAYYTWSNPLLQNLEDQMLVPMFSDAPIEMDMADALPDILARLQQDPKYQMMFHDAFPSDAQPFTIENVINSIACFERTLISATSPFDKYMAGDLTAMSDAAVAGFNEFNTEKFDCYHCHAGTTFSTSFASANTPPPPRDFRNTGVYNVDGMGAYPEPNLGLIDFTGFNNDMGKFKVPTLRNLLLTGPYFHDGSASTLDEVLQAYAHGGRLIPPGQPNAGDGSLSPHRDPLVKGFPMSADEENDMLAFFDALTDRDFVNNPAYANPSCPDDLPDSCPSAVPSWATDVQPIIQTVCAAQCHAPGGVAANRALGDYASVMALSTAILNQVSNCNMPPTNADPQLGEADRSTLLAWIVCGAPNN